MSDLAIDTLVGLTTRLREAGDAATASEALALAQTIAKDESLVPTRALGAALIDLASALVPWGPGPAVQALFVQAERVLKAAGDARITFRTRVGRQVTLPLSSLKPVQLPGEPVIVISR